MVNGFWKKVEHFVDKAIPYLILILLVIVIMDVFYKETAAKYHAQILVFDYIILIFFVADLIFKWFRVRNVAKFFKLYWLDVVAVFPFVLVLRMFEEILLISEGSIATLRNLFHAGVIVEEEVLIGEEAGRIAKEAEIIAKEAELVAKEGRIARFIRFFKPLQRTPRLLKAVSFYEHPSEKETLLHKLHKKKKKQ